MTIKVRSSRRHALVPAAREARTVDPKYVLGVIRHAIKVGLHAFHYGSCGPAAIAINKVLFGGRGTYVIATCKEEFECGHMSGHVAVRYGEHFYDYKGKCSVAELLKYVGRSEFVIISDVPERLVRSFFPGQPPESAERILVHAIEDIRTDSCALAIRKHKLDLDETRRSKKWSSNPTTKAVAKLWKTRLDARRRRPQKKARKRKRSPR